MDRRSLFPSTPVAESCSALEMKKKSLRNHGSGGNATHEKKKKKGIKYNLSRCRNDATPWQWAVVGIKLVDY